MGAKAARASPPRGTIRKRLILSSSGCCARLFAVAGLPYDAATIVRRRALHQQNIRDTGNADMFTRSHLPRVHEWR